MGADSIGESQGIGGYFLKPYVAFDLVSPFLEERN